MLIDGEKYACEACVRGHRVSNCQHSDRPLQHINKKGRPVSQCQHCRAMRKSRSSHVKCDCGEKTHKCAHLKQTIEGHKDSCCCNHGGRCTCSHKKEPSLDTVPESDLSDDAAATVSKPKPAPHRRRRTNTEPILSFDENGHHRPSQRHTKASQKTAPYAPLPRGSSSTSSSASSSMHRTTSASSLGTKSSSSSSRGAGSASPERRLASSAHASPSIASNHHSSSSSSFAHLNGQLPPLDLSGIRFPDYSSSSEGGGAGAFDLFSGVSADYEPPMFSAGLSSAASVDWAQYELKSEPAPGGGYDHARAYLGGGLDFGSTAEPTLTSGSGDVSETEDFVSAFSGEPAFDAFPDGGARYRGGMSSSSAAAAGGMLGSSVGTDLSNLDFDQFKATSKLLSTQSSFDDGGSVFPLVEDDAYWGINNFTDGITHSPDPVASGLWDTA